MEDFTKAGAMIDGKLVKSYIESVGSQYYVVFPCGNRMKCHNWSTARFYVIGRYSFSEANR